MQIGKDLIVVTGATGQQGGATARELLAAGHRVRAVTRKPGGDAARVLAGQGAEVVRGDLDDRASLHKAFTGAWGLYALQNTWEAGVEQEEVQGMRVVEVARATGVEHFVYASVASAHRKTGIPHFDNKARVEQKLRSVGFPSHTIVRPVFFMENLTSPWFKPSIDQGTLALGLKPTTKLQMIAVADVGKYGQLAFERHAALNGRAIDIAGDELTPPETAALIGQAAGRAVTHFQVPIEDVRKASADFAAMLEWLDAVGYNAEIGGNAKEFGIAPTRFADWVKTVRW
ncbi:MAG TPA: NmrA/HSCARG family protein [Gemmatimonadales bacterium]